MSAGTPKTIAVFGAGPALGLAVARRFGREGFRAALVSRTAARLDELVATLAAEGVEAAAFPADLADPAQAEAAVDAIERRFGTVDVLEYSPGGLSLGFAPTPITETGPAELRGPIDLFLNTPVGLARRVLPGMLERGEGTLLFSQGTSGRHPLPMLGNVGTAMAAMRHHVLTLNAALAGTGVYTGLLSIGGGIAGSEVHALMDGAASSSDGPALPEVEILDPADLAGLLWDLHLKRDRTEETAGNFGV
ncbi:SDR family NAD(P)-dependent oxidoreductase [Actinomadura rugatobispora]|uniref:SDR family NAD(P)-dependent oxidoreductase n=1 Tax=Actinomadura rugatobispora TaxID=1994 RepID=A0ABW1AJ71_9ACTN|nr:SDR family NAD(P)-dependent oxidoreductase [Actinomadura rugatobispora]